ncbi:TPA: hypothetical protein DEP90_01730 [Patescibacteria group bacterium]|nr:hypothetical protein [Patescibacteria group bacterium]
MKNFFRFFTLLLISTFIIGTTRDDAMASQLSTCGDSFSNATMLQQGEYSGGVISKDSDCYYYINVTNGYELNIDYELTANHFLGDVTLYDSDENKLVSEGEENGTLRWLGANEGESQNKYYLVIKSSYAIDSFALSINLIDEMDAGKGEDAGGDFDNFIEIEYGEYTGYLSSFTFGNIGGNDEKDYYKLAVKKGDKVTIQVTPKGNFYTGCAVYDNKRSALFNDDGLDGNAGEIILETFNIDKDGYIFIVAKMSSFSGSWGEIDEYTLLVTNESVNSLGGEIGEDSETPGEEVNNVGSLSMRNPLILGFSIVLGILLLVFIIVIISMLSKKKKKGVNKKEKTPTEKKNTQQQVSKQIIENKDNIKKVPKVEKVNSKKELPNIKNKDDKESHSKVKVTVNEGTDVEVKMVDKKKETN